MADYNEFKIYNDTSNQFPSKAQTSKTDKLISQLYDLPKQIKGVAQDIVNVCDEIAQMLIDKNRRYGNSVLEPVRVFSKSDELEQLRVRIDDKFSRLRNLQEDDQEDVVNDLIGYLILYKIAERKRATTI